MSLTENTNPTTYFENMFGKEIQLPRELMLLFSTMALDFTTIGSRMNELPSDIAQKLSDEMRVVLGEIGAVKETILDLTSAEGLVKEFGLPQSALAVPIYLLLLKILDNNEKIVSNSVLKAEQAINKFYSFLTLMTTVVFDLEIEWLERDREKDEKAITSLNSDALVQNSSHHYVVEAVMGGINKMQNAIRSSKSRKANLLAQKQQWQNWVDKLFANGRKIERVQEVVLYSAS